MTTSIIIIHIIYIQFYFFNDVLNDYIYDFNDLLGIMFTSYKIECKT